MLLIVKLKLSVLVQLVYQRMIKKQETKSRMVRFFQMHSPSKQKRSWPRFVPYFYVLFFGAHTKANKLDLDLITIEVKSSWNSYCCKYEFPCFQFPRKFFYFCEK